MSWDQPTQWDSIIGEGWVKGQNKQRAAATNSTLAAEPMPARKLSFICLVWNQTDMHDESKILYDW